MTEDAFHQPGTVIDEAEAMRLGSTQTRHLAEACRRHDDFEIVAFRNLGMLDNEPVIALEVICDNRRVTAFNSSGIRPVERLLLSWWPRARRPSVRALRKDFPRMLHQNAVPADAPASLCLYSQEPADVVRSLTPERHLGRILQWLECSAEGTLHAHDQELEGLFYTGGMHLILPSGFGELEHGATMSFMGWKANGIQLLRPLAPAPGSIVVPALVVRLPPVPHVPMVHVPQTLGEFAQQMGTLWQVDIEAALRESLAKAYPPGHLHPHREATTSCLVFVIPRARQAGDASEREDIIGMLIATSLEVLAEEMGVLTWSPDPRGWLVDGALAGTSPPDRAWHQRGVEAVIPAQETLNRAAAQRLSDIAPFVPAQPRVLAGAGAAWWSMHNQHPAIGMGALRVPGAELAPEQRRGLRQVVRQARAMPSTCSSEVRTASHSCWSSAASRAAASFDR